MRELQRAHKELPSEADKRSFRPFDALRELVCCFGRVGRGDVWSSLHEEAVRKGKEKLNKHQQEFTQDHDKDADNTFNAFQRDFVTEIIKDPQEMGHFIVKSKSNSGEALYTNSINTNNGEIIGIVNNNHQPRGWDWRLSEAIFNPALNINHGEITEITNDNHQPRDWNWHLSEVTFNPALNINHGEITGITNDNHQPRDWNWHLSEVIFNQLQLAMRETKKDITSFNLKNWRDQWITDEATRSTVKLFLPKESGERTFEKGSEGFLALAGTPTAQSKFYLSAQHQKALGQKEVTSITVQRQPGGYIHINYNYSQERKT
jgi:hypothetical protein